MWYLKNTSNIKDKLLQASIEILILLIALQVPILIFRWVSESPIQQWLASDYFMDNLITLDGLFFILLSIVTRFVFLMKKDD